MKPLHECEACGLEYAKEQLVRHRCIGTRNPTVDDLLQYVGAESDEHGCLRPTRYVKRLGYKGKYCALSAGAARVVGEWYLHRAILKLKLGRPIGAGMEASHECGRGRELGECANPDHIVERTHQQNHAYMSAETRSRISRAGGYASPGKFKPGHITWNKKAV